MRSNLFLHFLNRDSREIYGLYRSFKDEDHYRRLRRALNASVLLCEDYCIMPPGFIIEDDIAFRLAEAQKIFLKSRVLQFPMREENLGDYAEKKRIEYYPLRNRYSGLFDDSRVDFLSRHADGLIKRRTRISDEIVIDWQEGADKNEMVWGSVKKLIVPNDLDFVRHIPTELADSGLALTWSAIEPHLSNTAKVAVGPLRNALQHIYFSQYCREFGLKVLSSIPLMTNEFFLPREPRSYSYERFFRFLACFHLQNTLLEASAQFLTTLRNNPSFISFIDSYVQLAEKSDSITDLAFWASTAAEKSQFNWLSFAQRCNPFVAEPSYLELLELNDGLSAVANFLSDQHSLVQRVDNSTNSSASKMILIRGAIRPMPKITLFVALQEELDILTSMLNLSRNTSSPAASGLINETRFDLLCPREMGRVPAAVEVTSYLEKRAATLPELILIVGLAGGFKNSGTQPGQIICATTVVDLANRKVQDTKTGCQETKFHRKDYVLNPALFRLLNSDAFNQSEWISESINAADWPKDRRPSFHSGLLASIDEVVASDEWQKKLLDNTAKLLGVEMEAGGVCAAAQRYNVQVSMLRVVSDNADPSKVDDNWRKTGMKTLAILLKKLPYELLLDEINTK